MMKTRKEKIMTFGEDQWETIYERLSELCGVRVEVRLIRPNRKWYQSRYLAKNFGYWLANDTRRMDEEELYGCAFRMIEEFYSSENKYEALDNFFNKA